MSFRSIPAFLLALTLPLHAAAQAPPIDTTKLPAPAVAPDTKGPIRLNVVVTPKDGAPVADLPQSAFTVLDNGKPVPITAFRAVKGSAQPLQVLIAIDNVNIGYTQLAYERGQIQSFLKSNDGQLPFPTSLAVINETGTEILPGFTKDGNQLNQVLDSKQIGLRNLPRNSGIYGAEDRLRISLDALQGLLANAAKLPGRKMILWVSPGWPFISGPNIQLSNRNQEQLFGSVVAFTNQLRLSNVTLYAVNPLGAQEGPGRIFYYEEFLKGVRKPSQVYPGNLSLQVLATNSGGLTLNGSNDIRGELQRCIDDGKAFYQITYTPPPPDAENEFHQIEVRVNQPGLKARTTTGYYAQP